MSTQRQFGLQVEGLDKLRKELRSIDRRLSKPLQHANKRIAERVVNDAQRRIRGEPSPMSSKAAKGIRARAKQNEAQIALLRSNPVTMAAVLGALSHPVYGRVYPQSAFDRPVWRPWIGSNWSATEGPYGVADAIQSNIPWIREHYLDAVMDAFAAAFPHG